MRGLIKYEALPGGNAWDEAVLHWVTGHRYPWLTQVMKIASTLGSTAVLECVVVLVGLAVAWYRRWWLLGFIVGVGAVAPLVSHYEKRSLARSRPPTGDRLVSADYYSLPSGHALLSMAIGLAVAICLGSVLPMMRSVQMRVLGLASAVVFSAVVGFSRVYLGVHWATDVVFGWCIGALVCWAVWWAVYFIWRIAGVEHGYGQRED